MTTQIKDATGATVTRMTFDDIVGTAGSANANVTTVQGISGGTPQPISGSVTANLGTTDSTNLATVATQQTSATTGIGAISDAAWTGSGNGSSISVLKGIYAAPSIGTYLSTLPTLTNGQTNSVLFTTKGETLSAISQGGLAAIVQATPSDGAAANSGGGSLSVYAIGRMWNGATYDRQRKVNIYKRVASSAASGNPDFLKASAGDLVQFWGQNGAAITYLQVYNKASAPTIGTDTPILTYPIPASSVFNQIVGGTGGAYFSTGIAYAFTTDAAGTTGAAAAAVTAFNIMGA